MTGVQTCALPILTITETEPALKGQTVSSSFKPAVLSNGVRIMVPQFINVDDEIVVETEERTYEIGRASCRERV